jgi:hypothetical protein
MNRADSTIERNNELAMRVAKGFVAIVMIVIASMMILLVRA